MRAYMTFPSVTFMAILVAMQHCLGNEACPIWASKGKVSQDQDRVLDFVGELHKVKLSLFVSVCLATIAYCKFLSLGGSWFFQARYEIFPTYGMQKLECKVTRNMLLLCPNDRARNLNVYPHHHPLFNR